MVTHPFILQLCEIRSILYAPRTIYDASVGSVFASAGLISHGPLLKGQLGAATDLLIAGGAVQPLSARVSIAVGSAFLLSLFVPNLAQELQFYQIKLNDGLLELLISLLNPLKPTALKWRSPRLVASGRDWTTPRPLVTGAVLKAVTEEQLSRPHLVLGYFPENENVAPADILKFLEDLGKGIKYCVLDNTPEAHKVKASSTKKATVEHKAEKKLGAAPPTKVSAV
uniref:Uncharacterized protein n=1 Tax=Glossina austeni TaxID=7395 RepID=A0A1A9VE54_GLOAU